jgi:hypothetical protein
VTAPLYAFRFDLNGDSREESSFKVRFGAVLHAEDQDRTHVQSFEARRASGPAAASCADGDLVVVAHTRARGRDSPRGEGFRRLGSGSIRGRRNGLGRTRYSIRTRFKTAEILCRSKSNRAGARGAPFPQPTKCRAWLSDGVALRPRAGDPSFPMGAAANHEHLHAEPDHARGFQPHHSVRGYPAFFRSDLERSVHVAHWTQPLTTSQILGRAFDEAQRTGVLTYARRRPTAIDRECQRHLGQADCGAENRPSAEFIGQQFSASKAEDMTAPTTSATPKNNA